MIESYRFGRIVILGKTYVSDVKIVNGVVIPEWWRRNGHNVCLSDISDFFDAPPEIVVMGKGSPGHMTVGGDVKTFLKQKGITLFEEPSARAVDTFNSHFEKGIKVYAGFHLTC